MDDAERTRLPDGERFRREYLEAIQRWAEWELTAPAGSRSRFPLPSAWPMVHFEFAIAALESACEELKARSSALGDRAASCPLASAGSAGDSDAVGLVLTPVGRTPQAIAIARATGLKEIRDFTRDARKLMIVDPYAFGGPSDTASVDEYVDHFCHVARLDGGCLSALHVIFDSTKGQTKSIRKSISARAKEAGVRFTESDTNVIHDRVWIADRERGLVVGTSFGGLGQRSAFLLDLPTADLKHVLEFFDESGLTPSGTRRARNPKTKQKHS